MSIGRSIINGETLSLSQADEVIEALIALERAGFWSTPDWAIVLANHYQVAEATISVQLAGWRAAALTYQETHKGQ